MKLPPFSGVVLAGGASSRFGENKARYIYQGKPLIEWVLQSLSEAGETFIIANDAYERIKTYKDLIPGGNSLGGLYTALSYAHNEWVAVAACDLPFLTSAYWQFLLEQTTDTQIVIAQNAKGKLEPLAALYHRSILPIVKKQLEQGDLRMKHISEIVHCKTISWSVLNPHFEDHLFLNANYKTDLL